MPIAAIGSEKRKPDRSVFVQQPQFRQRLVQPRAARHELSLVQPSFGKQRNKYEHAKRHRQDARLAPRMRSEIGKLASPKKPMPNVVVKTIVSALMKAAVAAKTGWQRAASHNSIGNSSATGTTVPQSPCGRKITNPFRMTSATSAATPSTNPRRDGGWRAAEANSND